MSEKRGREPERLCSFEGVEAEGREAERSGVEAKEEATRIEAERQRRLRKKRKGAGSGERAGSESGGLRES